MTALKINSITLKQFRTFRDLHIDGLGRVNLLTGENNTGKSSVLEGLRILSSNAAFRVISDILQSREEDIEIIEEEGSSVDPGSLFQMSGLFHGFPRLSERLEPIAISANGGSKPMKLTMSVDWFSEERGPEGDYRLVPQQFDDPGSIGALVIETEEMKRFLRLDRFHRYSGRRSVYLGASSAIRMPCTFVSPYSGRRTARLAGLWDKAVQADRDKDVIEALRILDSEITNVFMVGVEDTPRSLRKARVRANNIPRPVPLRSFGDGINRLFSIILSLVNAGNGLLLIDEFENGLHYSSQLEVWRMIFRLAQKLDIQVFATTHSWDAVEAFQKAAQETPETGVLIRLARRKGDIIPWVVTEDKLAIATRGRIEVR